jgi:hypothetical protein
MCKLNAKLRAKIANLNAPLYKVVSIDTESLQNRLLKVCYVTLLAPVFRCYFFAVAINNTNEANKAVGMHL